MMQMTWYFHQTLISIGETFPESLVKIRHDDVMWRHVTSFSKIRMTSRDVIWRHHVKFLPNYQKMFFSLIWRYGAKMKLYVPFKTELWIFSHIMTSQPHHSTIIDDVIAKMMSQKFLLIFLKVYSHSHNLGKFHDSPTIFTVFTEGGISPPDLRA